MLRQAFFSVNAQSVKQVETSAQVSGSQGKSQGRRTTIYDIAELAGTSPSAVSAILNGSWKKRRIAETTAQRVIDIAEAEGYARNLQASALRSDRSNVIGMIMPKYDNRYFGAIAEQFEAKARARGLFPVITCTERDPELEVAAAREMIGYRVDCIIATGATDPDRITRTAAAAGIRTLNLDLPGREAPSVISDNYNGARELALLLLDRIGPASGPLLFVGGRGTDHNTAERIRGVRDAHEARGLALPESHVLTCGYASDKAQSALDTLAFDVPEALFVNSTISLEGVVRWMRSNGQTLPFGCFDWDPFAALLEENVGMVKQDVTALVSTIFDRLDEPSGEADVIQIPCILCTE
ncbi:HTH-type transcriptional regulator DegA [Roseivivax jejudonensis]|uniref:HTH-type transcriptional regulator DegA n=2 Tax=Roseivivax jejudonensis TaxID=1529041 RepID=A0A1X6ZZ38_9RHOB|nr:HTH-type transcriptional regulator DegA [Roseivivax jejudonensis]